MAPPPPLEWDGLNEVELATMKHIYKGLGNGIRDMPYDLLVQHIRGYSKYDKPMEESLRRVRNHIEFRTKGADAWLLLGADRDNDEAWQQSFLGFAEGKEDGTLKGKVVLLIRAGKLNVDDLKALTDDEAERVAARRVEVGRSK